MKRRVLATVLGVAATVAGCNLLLHNDGEDVAGPAVDASTADAPPDATPAACSSLAGDLAQCQACLDQECCSQSAACAASPACAAYEGCVIPCGTDDACRARCTLDHRAASPEIAAMDQCLASHCQTPCGVSCGLTGSGTSPDAAAACAECIVARDCDKAQACATSLECLEILGCEGTCATPDCQAACPDGLDAGAALASALTQAFAGTCLEACEYGKHWDCVGKVTNPLPKGPQVALDVSVSTGQAALGGVTVLACNLGSCATPLANGTTDATGHVVLTLPLGAGGFTGYLALSAAGYEPEQFFFAYRLSEVRSDLQLYMFTSATLAGLVGAAGVTLDPARGVVIVGTGDCDFQAAQGVAVQATGTDGQTKVLYLLANQILSATATVTDAPGVAFLVNVPAGTIGLTAEPGAIGRTSSQGSVLVSPGTVSYVSLVPNE